MPKPRHLLVDVDVTPYYHCISRCVRRAFLCGPDRFSGRSFAHRKPWVVGRLRELAAVFAVDVNAYDVLSNHFHVVLRIDRDRALAWSDDEVVRRWAVLFPERVTEIASWTPEARSQKIARWRERLWSLSWFMRCLNENIARRANREDRCTGRFWEGRFRSQALLDMGAVLACMSYVDLNEIRAGMAETLEESEFASIRERLLAAGGGLAQAKPGQAALVPFRGDESPMGEAAGIEPLSITLGEYVELLEATGAVIRRNAVEEALPAPVETTLRGLGLDPTRFAASVRELSRSFFTMIGHAHRIDAESRRRGYRKRRGIAAAERLYGWAA